VIWLQLLAVAFLAYALWKMRPQSQTTYFTRDFGLDHRFTVTLNGKELKQGKDYTVAADNVIVFTGPDLSGEATVTMVRQEPL
jgi:hypothetical protein